MFTTSATIQHDELKIAETQQMAPHIPDV